MLDAYPGSVPDRYEPTTFPAEAQLQPDDYLMFDQSRVSGEWGREDTVGRLGDGLIIWAPAPDQTRYDPSSTDYRPGASAIWIEYNGARTLWERR